jgi:hypothetical protein
LTINDVHLDLENETKTPDYSSKTSPGLLKTMLTDAKSQMEAEGGVDLILLVGDNCKHGMAAYQDSNPPQTPDWEAM